MQNGCIPGGGSRLGFISFHPPGDQSAFKDSLAFSAKSNSPAKGSVGFLAVLEVAADAGFLSEMPCVFDFCSTSTF